MKIVKIDVSIKFLEAVLKNHTTPFLMRITNGLPEDAEILWSEITEPPYRLRLIVKSEMLGDVCEKNEIPFITPLFHKIQ